MVYKIIKYIAKKTDLYNEFKTSTIKFSKELNESQQNISRKLILMEKQKLIIKSTNNKGLTISLTQKSRDILKKELNELLILFKPKKELFGKIVNGLGEGAYYVNIYSDKIKKITKFKPFLGTLNLKINKNDFENFIMDLKPHLIKEFQNEKRTYGEIKIYDAILNNDKIAILKPKRTIHSDDIIEIIAPFNIKEKFNLKENDKIILNKIN
jgi:riboflavin kinase, archaea type